MVNTPRTLHYTFGPVQGFVAQARRTRDLWAGSYILSFLAGHAMRAVVERSGRILFPAIDHDPLFLAICDEKRRPPPADAVQVGSLPNRFKAAIPAEFDPNECSNAIRSAWTVIARAVWNKIGEPLESADIWKRQIATTWQCVWAISDDERALDLRKNLRSDTVPAEGGEKCMVCGERQEVSGEPGGTREPSIRWWRALKKRAGISHLDLRDRERLCAVCLTKRLFPRVAREAIGWNVPVGFPSTSYMAAVPWVATTIAGHPDAAAAYCQQAEAAGVGKSESSTRIAVISQAIPPGPQHAAVAAFADLDGSAFFETTLANESFPLNEGAERQSLIGALRDLCKLVGDAPSPFYALLLMDGDGMGRLLGSCTSLDQQAAVSAALAEFARDVRRLVRAHDGRLVYAGGDDVLALLPIDGAFACAAALRHSYQEAFARTAPFVRPVRATISAAIEYAHIHTPLGVVVRDAHRLLDKTAKLDTGRDAVACRVWKHGGPVLTWSMPWSRVLDVDTSVKTPAPTIVDEIRDAFTRDNGEVIFSSKLFYKIRELFELLEPADRDAAPTLNIDQHVLLLAAEYLATRELRWSEEMTTEEIQRAACTRMERLLALCRTSTRRVTLDDAETFTDGRLHADGALLVRFLAQKEV